MLTTAKMYNYIEEYGISSYGTCKLDDKSRKSMLYLWEKIKKIEPISESSSRRSFYFFTPKGSYQEYKKLFDEYFDKELFDNNEEKLKKLYDQERDEYFKLTSLYHKYKDDTSPYLGIYINDFYVLSINDLNEVEPEVDATEFISELTNITKGVLKDLKNNKYNENIKNNLPYYMKYGKIRRKYYNKVYTYEKEKYNITKEDRELLLTNHHNTLIPKTAREFYEACKVCYDSIGLTKIGSIFEDTVEERYRSKGNTPKEVYYSYADGRDDGLSQVPLDDETEFNKWLLHKEPYSYDGGHPFEIIFSMSGNHSVHLYLINNRLVLTCGEYPSNMHALKMYIALIKNGYNVEFSNLNTLLDIIDEKDYIGIIPTYTLYHPNDDENINEYIQLDDEFDYNRLKEFIQWDEIKDLKLIDKRSDI